MKVGKQAEKNCGTCKFSRERTQSAITIESVVEQVEVKVCARHAPTIAQTDLSGIWPSVLTTDVCGEYKYDGTSQ